MLSRASLLALEVVLFLPVKMVAANSAGERGKGGGGGGEWREEIVMIETWDQKQSVHQEVHPSGENFEAVVTFKQYCDKTTAS